MTQSAAHLTAHPSSPTRALIMTIGFVVSWAMIEIVAGTALHGISALETVWVRYTVHLIIVLAIWGPRGNGRPWITKRPSAQLIRSAMMLIMPASFLIAVVRGASNAMVFSVFWSAPLIVMALAFVLLHERVDARLWFAAALGWVGAWLFYGPRGVPTLGASVFSLAMAGSFALYVVMTRSLSSESLGANLFYTAVVPWLAFGLIMPRVWVTPSPGQIVALVFVGAVGLFSLFAVDRAADAAPVSVTAPLLHLETAATAVLSRFAGHSPSILRLVASTSLVGATAVVAWFVMRRSPSILEL